MRRQHDHPTHCVRYGFHHRYRITLHDRGNTASAASRPKYPTDVALRTVSESLAKAGSHMLEIESGELMAEYRPALTPAGQSGLEAEIFLYDTLAGGAGFSSQLVDRGDESD